MLKISNLDVFIGSKKIIQDISFQVKPGAIIGLIGPNGAGKTTIMKTVLGLTKFTGSITFNEQAITENNHKALKNVGALIENPAIYPFLTGKKNLKLYSHDSKNMHKVIEQLEMQDYIDHSAKGYSLGMKQKLGIAIALLNQPHFVILDEPMNGLDVEATIMVRKLIKQYARKGTAFLISSHILSELQKIMTEVVIINQGQLIVNKSISEFKRISQQSYQLLTDNQEKAVSLLQDQQIPVNKVNNYLVVNHQYIFSIQDLFYKNNLHLLEILPESADFEQLVVKLLKKKRQTAHEK